MHIWMRSGLKQCPAGRKSKYCGPAEPTSSPFLGSCCGAGNGAGGKSKCLLTVLGTISVLHLIASV